MNESTRAAIRDARPEDRDAMIALWNRCVTAGEVVYSPLDARGFAKQLDCPGSVMLVSEADGALAGWVHGMHGAGEDVGYLTAVFVDAARRGQGVGAALVRALEERLRADGAKVLACSGNNPVKLSWRVPGAPGHDHNNAPGVDEDCAGYPFLTACGLTPQVHEVAMYRDLSDYEWPAEMDAVIDKLAGEGIWAGRYEGGQMLEYDGMCDRVGSEYWRNVLRCELRAWETGEPCADETLWTDGERPKGPRPLLLAVHNGHIVGFTGPVARQRSGRGWFTGICVDPNFGRRSIGALLFHMLLRAFVQEGATFTTLFTGAENHAQQIYLRAGLMVVRRFAVMTKPLEEGAAYNQVHF